MAGTISINGEVVGPGAFVAEPREPCWRHYTGCGDLKCTCPRVLDQLGSAVTFYEGAIDAVKSSDPADTELSPDATALHQRALAERERSVTRPIRHYPRGFNIYPLD
jgi:hypothetical protein